MRELPVAEARIDGVFAANDAMAPDGPRMVPGWPWIALDRPESPWARADQIPAATSRHTTLTAEITSCR